MAAEYRLRKTRDARSAMAEALRAFLKRQSFALPKTTEPFQLAAVYDTWATFQDKASTAGGLLPAAAVLPDRPIYEADALTPRMLEWSWSGGDPCLRESSGRPTYPIGDGSGDGYALFDIAELSVPFVLLVRASTIPMRKAVVSRLEELFVEDGSLLDPNQLSDLAQPSPPEPPEEIARPIRYGRLLKLESYYGLTARYSLESQQLLDSETNAAQNRWLAQMEIQAHGKVVVVRRVRAMRPRVRAVIGGERDSRG